MQSDLVSVIVPIYNAAPYLNECLTSIANQTYKNFEAVLVDDGSTDNSGEIAEDFAKRDGRFKVIHQTNSGSSTARNTGMNFIFDSSKTSAGGGGGYVVFVDSDDVLDKNYISVMYDAMVLTGADICECNSVRNGEVQKNIKPMILTGDEILDAHAMGIIWLAPWRRMYRREVVENVRFPDGRDNGEDQVWSPKVFLNAKKACLISTPLYYHRARADSLSSKRETLKGMIGHHHNLVEKYSILIENVKSSEALGKVIVEFINRAFNIIETPSVEFSDIFPLIKSIAVKNDLKIAVAVQNKPVERLIFQLLLASKDWQSMRTNLQKYIAKKK